MEQIKNSIQAGETFLGIELGSTRIKAVLTDREHRPIASGSHRWKNQYEAGVWTYGMEEVWTGLRGCYQALAKDVEQKYGISLILVGAMGISAMMHGYIALDAGGTLLTPFRTWRNTITGPAAAGLTELFHFNIPQRWSVAHLYQAILNGEAHVPEIRFLTTLAGYVHWKLTGRRVLGIGDASGMFPIDSEICDYHSRMLGQFDSLTAEPNLPWKLRDILPAVLPAGESAGSLTPEGARLLDPAGALQPGIPLCPPEGDAGTGMVATNSVAGRTGNVSAGTSIFAMIVLERALKQVYPEIDMVTTPCGKPVAMVHCNNCTTDIDAWTGLFSQLAEAIGAEVDESTLYEMLFNKALEGDTDCGGLLLYNYHSGEHITGMEEGRPLFFRGPDSRFDLANFMRAQIYAALATLRLGMDILGGEQMTLDRLTGHGGLFKTPVVGQRMLAAATGVSISVMETAGEGGAWGIALLAAFMKNKAPGQTLGSYLAERAFAGEGGTTLLPDPGDVAGFEKFIGRYRQGLAVERAAVDTLR